VAAFEQHVNVAVIVSGVALVPIYSSSLIDMNQALMLLVFGILGGVLPDLDSDTSKPIQITFRILAIFIPLAILLMIGVKSLRMIFLIWASAGIILNFVVFKLFLLITNHRGIFHTIPMGILFSQLLFITLNHIFLFSIFFSTVSAVFLLAGFLIHLILDELFSINALGFRLKKSFGTALKLYDKNNIFGTILLYISIFIIYYYFPFKNSIFLKLYTSLEHLTF